jgi:hypothetical protein
MDEEMLEIFRQLILTDGFFFNSASDGYYSSGDEYV